MTWKIIFEKRAFKELSKLDRQIQLKINAELDRILQSDDPKLYGKALTANLNSLWRYRVGDYRIICKIEDSIFVIMVVRVAHRKEIYK